VTERSVAELPERSAYTDFLKQRKYQPTAQECEEWYAGHLDDPDARRSLVDAGWKHAGAGDHATALERFTQVLDLPDAQGNHAHARAGLAEALHLLGRTGESATAFEQLRAHLAAQPQPDLELYSQVIESLSELNQPELALSWCDTALARGAQDAETGAEADPERKGTLRGIQGSRRFLREDLDLEPDDLDREIEEDDKHTLAELRELLNELPSPRRVFGMPDGGAFNGVLLYWPTEQFAAARDHWPDAPYGDDHSAYCQQLEREARAYSEAGAARVFITTGGLDACLRYADTTGKDPDEATTRSSYGADQHERHPERSLPWPPSRNGPCWCGSQRKYKKCCGSPTIG
jgi:tetratricopeptide (TPR) repeat protein